MKIHCPKCEASCKIPDDKVPEQGVYARCPNCSARMLIQKKSKSSQPLYPERTAINQTASSEISLDDEAFAPPRPEMEDESIESSSDDNLFSLADKTSNHNSDHPSAPRKSFVSPPPAKSTKQSSAAPVRKSKNKTAEEEGFWDPDWEVPVSLGVEHAYSGIQKAITVFLGILILAVSIYILVSVRRSFVAETITPYKRHQSEPVALTETYPDWAFEQDLNNIRWRLIRNNFSTYQVRLRSPEFRVVEEIMIRCNLECEYILDVKITPRITRDGFMADISCGSVTNHVEYLWSINGAFSNDNRCY